MGAIFPTLEIKKGTLSPCRLIRTERELDDLEAGTLMPGLFTFLPSCPPPQDNVPQQGTLHSAGAAPWYSLTVILSAVDPKPVG